MSMRKEFEEWYWSIYGEAFECSRDEAFELDENGIHENEHARFSFESWKASRQSMAVDLEPVRDAIAVTLGEAMDCTRVWSAWGVGTMGEDDFALIAEDDGRLNEIAISAIEAAGFKVKP